jgi:AcrR family transcriptional regulator
MKNGDTKKRVRRTTFAIERDILNAVSEAISELGFARLNLKEVLDRGNVSLPVVYSHFGSLEKLTDKYVEKHDYWLNQTIDTDPASVTNPKEYYIASCESLIKSLYKNKELQQLFIWEMAENNPTTHRTSRKREAATEKLISYFEELFQGSGIDIKAVTAIIIGGIYHITLRKDRSTFCNTDFTKKAGQEKLISASKTIISLLYDRLEEQRKREVAIVKLLAEGVDKDIICRAYDIDEQAFRSISENLAKTTTSEKNSQ